MPIYVYDCDKCGAEVEDICKYSERDDPKEHQDCGGNLIRHGVQQFTHGAESFQPKAILADGRKIPGHFGKSARKKGGWYRP